MNRTLSNLPSAAVRHFCVRLTFAAFLALLFGLGQLSAQTFSPAPLDASQMPPQTLFYLTWRGVSTSEAKTDSSPLSLWNDPRFDPVRAALLKDMLSGSDKDPAKQKVLQAELVRYAPLLENSFVLGYLPNPEAKTKAASPKTSTTEHKWNGLFFVYDRSGKEALLKECVTLMRTLQKNPPKVSEITIAGLPASKFEGENGVTYWIETGKYAISASERKVLEDILPRLNGNSSAASSLAQTAAYQEAQPLLGKGRIEVFFRMPAVKEINVDVGSSGVKLDPLLTALRLNSVHSIAGSVVHDGAKARVQGAIFGDTAPGTIFDFWSDGVAAPPSLAFLSPDAISYSQMQIDLAAIFDTLMRIVTAALPSSQQAGVGMVEGLAQARIGMPLRDALKLFSGDFAAVQTSPDLDTEKAVYVLGIRQKSAVLKLVRTIFSDQISSEHSEGSTTFLKVSFGGGMSSAGVAQWNFYNLAITPDFIIVNKQSSVLHEFLAQHPQGAAPQLPAIWQAERGKFPEKLIGIGYANYEKVDWPGVVAVWRAQAAKSQKASTTTKTSNSKVTTTTATPNNDFFKMDWLNQMDPKVPSDHLHVAFGGSWKDAHGIHFDEWIQ